MTESKTRLKFHSKIVNDRIYELSYNTNRYVVTEGNLTRTFDNLNEAKKFAKRPSNKWLNSSEDLQRKYS